MAEIIPFRGIVYNAKKVSGDEVVAPPYDIITPELRGILYAKSPYNIVRIDAGEERNGDDEEDNKYRRAAAFLEQWLREGVLLRSERPSLYAYGMDYRTEAGRKRVYGFFGLVRLEELGSGIYPHEETHSKPKVDRFNLMKACRANTSPIFSLYHSPAKKASRVIERTLGADPYLSATDLQGDVHKLWVIDRPEDIDSIRSDLSDRAVFIADGHHRYETALEYQRMVGNAGGTEPSDYVLMFLANIADGGLTILPTHRIIRHSRKDDLAALAEHLEVETLSPGADVIGAMKGRVQTFGLCRKGDDNQYLLRYRGDSLRTVDPPLRDLDVTILHELIIKELLGASEILYEMDAAAAKELVRAGGYDAVFFLNPTRVEDVERVALSSGRMPPKSTYFYPKVMTGFVINSLRNAI